MQFGKRIFLFLLTNMLVVVTISLIMNLLGVGPYLTAYGLNYESLAIFCLIWGMGGAFISLLMSKVMAKWMMRVQIIEPSNTNATESWLYQTVERLAQTAGLPKTPEVGIYDSPEVNAFATGPSRGNALVAVSSGLLQRMDKNAIEGVLGHEVAHIANGDMVTMTLIQGIVNAFVMFFARILAHLVMGALRIRDSRVVYWLITMAFEVLLMFFGMIIVAWFSRYREYRADAGGAKVAGQVKMIQALQSLQQSIELTEAEAKPAIQTLKISTQKNKFLSLFSTHPPLEDRIARLQSMNPGELY